MIGANYMSENTYIAFVGLLTAGIGIFVRGNYLENKNQ